MSEEDHLLAVKRELIRRLQVLELQEARYGYETPPHIVLEIDDLKKRIKLIDIQVADLGSVKTRLTENDTEVLFSKATRLFLMGDLGRAVELYLQVQKISPRYPLIQTIIRELEQELKAKYVNRSGQVDETQMFEASRALDSISLHYNIIPKNDLFGILSVFLIGIIVLCGGFGLIAYFFFPIFQPEKQTNRLTSTRTPLPTFTPIAAGSQALIPIPKPIDTLSPTSTSTPLPTPTFTPTPNFVVVVVDASKRMEGKLEDGTTKIDTAWETAWTISRKRADAGQLVKIRYFGSQDSSGGHPCRTSSALFDDFLNDSKQVNDYMNTVPVPKDKADVVNGLIDAVEDFPSDKQNIGREIILLTGGNDECNIPLTQFYNESAYKSYLSETHVIIFEDEYYEEFSELRLRGAKIAFIEVVRNKEDGINIGEKLGNTPTPSPPLTSTLEIAPPSPTKKVVAATLSPGYDATQPPVASKPPVPPPTPIPSNTPTPFIPTPLPSNTPVPPPTPIPSNTPTSFIPTPLPSNTPIPPPTPTPFAIISPTDGTQFGCGPEGSCFTSVEVQWIPPNLTGDRRLYILVLPKPEENFPYYVQPTPSHSSNGIWIAENVGIGLDDDTGTPFLVCAIITTTTLPDGAQLHELPEDKALICIKVYR